MLILLSIDLKLKIAKCVCPPHQAVVENLKGVPTTEGIQSRPVESVPLLYQ